MKSVKDFKKIYQDPDFHLKYTYEGEDLGVMCSKEGTCFRLWSPLAEQVNLLLYKSGETDACYLKVPMHKGEKGVWIYETKEYLHGVYYNYELKIEQRDTISGDPYARACGVNGHRSMVVDLKKTDPVGWDQDRAPRKTPETIIYELHVKEFSWDPAGGFPEEVRGTYKAFTCEHTTLNQDGVHPTGLDYLKRLGVTHIQIMPAYDYGSVDETSHKEQFNWGYDPVNYNVPEGSYATDPYQGSVRIREFKEMIQSLHKNGFRVIMDVVYNHTYSLDSCLQKTMPWYYYRVWEDGRIADGSACGNDIASERAMCRKYIVDSVLYWAKEYHIDGFRFDLMGLLDTELMNQIGEKLEKTYGKGEKIIFGEPWAAGKTPIEGENPGALKKNLPLLRENIGIFCDNTRDAVKGHVFKGEIPGFVNGGTGLEQDILDGVLAWCGSHGKRKEIAPKHPGQIISYVSAHDNWTLWDKLLLTGEKTENCQEVYQRCMEEYRLAAGIYLTCQGNLFFLSGEEFARTKEGLENSYNASISINRLDWKRAWDRQELVDYYRGLIALRKQLFGLCDKSSAAADRMLTSWKKEKAVGYCLNNKEPGNTQKWECIYVVYNAGEQAMEVELPQGQWEILADKENSFAWKNPAGIEKTATAAGKGILILGQK